MELRLAALDMDGTLLNSAHRITPAVRSALDRVAAAGKLPVLCTGRCLSELKEHLAELPAVRYVIAENGGYVYDARDGGVLHQARLDQAQARRVLELTDGLEVCRQAFFDGQSYMECGDDARLRRCNVGHFIGVFRAGSVPVEDLRAFCLRRGGAPGKLNLYFADRADRDAVWDQLRDSGLRMVPSIGVGIEISPPQANKALGLRALCGRLGLDPAQCMAVGDGPNDLDLLRAAGFAVAMGNATEEIMAAANAVVDDCDHDGAAEALLRYMLGESEK